MTLRNCHEPRRAVAYDQVMVEAWVDVDVPMEKRRGVAHPGDAPNECSGRWRVGRGDVNVL